MPKRVITSDGFVIADIVRRLQAASGPDIDLDREIALATGGRSWEIETARAYVAAGRGHEYVPDERNAQVRASVAAVWCYPPVTSSLDDVAELASALGCQIGAVIGYAATSERWSAMRWTQSAVARELTATLLLTLTEQAKVREGDLRRIARETLREVPSAFTPARRPNSEASEK